MNFRLSWREGALHDLEKLELLLRKRIIKKVISFANSGVFHGVKRVQGYEKMYRLRAGDYRVIFELNKNLLIISKIGHRKNIY